MASLALLDVLLLLSLSAALSQAPSSMAICLACIFAHVFLSARWVRRRIDQGNEKPFQTGFWIGLPVLVVAFTPGGWLGLALGSRQPVGYAGLAAIGMVVVLGLLALACVTLGALAGVWAVLIDAAWQRVERGDDDNAHLRLGAVLFAGWFLVAMVMLMMSKWPGTLEPWPVDTPLSGMVLVVSWYVALAASGVSLLWSLVAIVTRRD